MSKELKIIKLVVVIAGIVAIIGLFLPYERSIGDYRQELKEKPDKINMQEVDYTNGDVVDISIVENLKVYHYAMNNSNGSDYIYGESLINIIITIALIVSIVLVLLFTLLNKRVLTIIFDVILAISSLLMNFDIVSRGVIPSTRYTYGISYYLYIVVAIIILICTILLIIKNKKAKTQTNLT